MTRTESNLFYIMLAYILYDFVIKLMEVSKWANALYAEMTEETGILFAKNV